MADSRVQQSIAKWVIDQWVPANLGIQATCEPCPLTSGGEYRFDGVSYDKTTVICVSTSDDKTNSGKKSSGSQLRIRGNLYFLLLSKAERKLLLLTEEGMFNWCKNEQRNGRIPDCIEIIHVGLPMHLQAQVAEARMIASAEVSPRS